MFGKKKVAMLVAELLGTGILTLVILSVRSSGIGYPFFVSIGAGLGVASLTFVLGAASGAQLNPALTIGLWTTRAIKTLPAILYVAMQLAGGALAYWFYTYLVKNHLQNTAGHFEARTMIAEALGAFVFVWGWAAAATYKLEGWQKAAVAGSSFAIGIMVASLASGAIINPAVALGSHSWGWGTYVLGPVVGGVVAANAQHYLFTFKAERTAVVAAKPTTVAATSTASTTKKTTSKRSTKKSGKK